MQLISPADAAGRVTAALKGAAEATGAGFDYLLRTAKRESSLNPTAQAPTSSARGLFQFIDQTWLQVLKEEGPKLGLGAAAADVSRSASGRYAVTDPGRRAELLAMRDDPQAAALLAGAFTRRNAAALTGSLGRAPTEGELYAAHFLGAQGATQLVTLAATTPAASAADAFPAQAASNRSIFYDQGRPRSVSEVYAKLTATPAAAAPAVSAEAPAKTAVAQRWVVEGAETPAPYNNGVEDDRAAFHSLFKTGRRSPVSAYVAQTWSAFGAEGLAAGARFAQAQPAPRAAAAAFVSEAAEPAYRTTAAAEAVDAVTVAATKNPRRKSAQANALPYAPVQQTPVPVARPVAAPAAKPGFDLGDFLRSVFAPAEASAARKDGRP